jgi:phytoene desaturase
VDVYERLSYPGGKAGSHRAAGYRFDTGPSLITLPEVYADLFAAGGRQIEDFLELVPISPICRYFWDDQTVFNGYPGVEAPAREANEVFGEPTENVRSFLAYSETIYRLTAELFLERSLHDPRTFFSRRFLASLLQVGRIDAFRTMNDGVAAHIAHPRLVQLFNRYATYNGSDPYQTPATLNIIPHVEYGLGGYASRAGIHAIPQAICALARSMGVAFHWETPVQRILSDPERDRRITGILVDDEKLGYDAVVCNVDVTRMYEDLLDDREAPLYQRYRRLEPSSSGLVFFWGMSRPFRNLTVNNIFFSNDYPKEFRRVFTDHRVPEDPTVYVNITSKVTPDDAPANGENWFVLLNVPFVDGQDWDGEVHHARELVLERLSRALGTPVAEAVAYERVMTPLDIERDTGSYRGSLYGIASNNRMAAFLRHPNRSRRYPGLYVCGGSAHPGGGMPLSILSGKIAAELAKRYED